MMVGPGAAGPAETPAGFTMLYNPAPILVQTNKQREANMLFTMLCNPVPILAQTHKQREANMLFTMLIIPRQY